MMTSIVVQTQFPGGWTLGMCRHWCWCCLPVLLAGTGAGAGAGAGASISLPARHPSLSAPICWASTTYICAIYCKREMTRWSWLSYTPFAKSSGLCLENHLLDNRRPAYIWWYVNVSWLMWSHVVSFQVAHDLLLSIKFCHQIATFSTRTKCKIVSIINKT